MPISRRCGRRGDAPAVAAEHADARRTQSSRIAPEQLFDLVADVGKYPEFLPWCVGARVRSRTETELVADLTIGFGPFRESFTSRVALDAAAPASTCATRTARSAT